MPRPLTCSRIPLLLAALVLALGLLAAGCGGGDDDDPGTTTSPPVTSGPLARGEPEALIRRAYRQLLNGPYEANSSTTVQLSGEGVDDDVLDQARELEPEVDLRVLAESPRRRQLELTVSAAGRSVFATIVEYDGEAFFSAGGSDDEFRPLAPALVETLGGTGTEDFEPLLESLGPIADAGDDERGGQPVRAYEAPLDVAYLRRNAGTSLGNTAAGATFTEASARFELQTADGRLAYQGIAAQPATPRAAAGAADHRRAGGAGPRG